MPITLPAFTRRDMLKQATATGLSLLAIDELPAQENRRQETWILFSDTHIAEDKSRLSREINMASHLQQAVKEVLARQEKERAFGLFVNGDLALTEGLPGDYRTFTELMKPLREAGIDVHLTLGNHDDREKFWEGCGELTPNQKLLPLKHLGVITSATVNWVLLDSLDQVNVTPGSLGDSQIAWLDRTLRNLPDKPTLILTHHTPQPALTAPDQKRFGLQDTEAFMRVVDSHAKVKAWIFGHSHAWDIKTKNSGLHQINLPPVAYTFNQAMPSGWVSARVDAQGMELELHSLNPAHPAHAKVTRLAWA